MEERPDQDDQDTGPEMNPEQWRNYLATGKLPSPKDFVIITGTA